jgi:two-component system nitrate/nitrite response regulator NarL
MPPTDTADLSLGTTALHIVMVEDQALCREAISAMLSAAPEITVTLGSTAVDELKQTINDEKPSLLLIDIGLGAVNGLDLLAQLQRQNIDTPVVVLTMSESDGDLAKALRSGVRGYLVKDMPPKEVIQGLRSAADGNFVIAPKMASRMADLWQTQSLNNHQVGAEKQLTDREKEVLRLVAQGKTNKIIARELDISHNTVKLHVKHIMSKLSINSRVELALYAYENKSI